MKRRSLLCAVAALMGAATAQAEENANLASFDQVWNTIRLRHWDKEKVGAPWDRARAELRPAAERAKSADEVRPLIEKMLATLGQSHFHVIPAVAYEQLEDGRPAGTAHPAFDIRVLGGEAVVTRGGGGVQAGWTIETIGSTGIEPLLKRVHAVAKGPREAKLLGYSVLRQRLSGDAGQTRTVTFATGGGERKTIDVPLVAPSKMVRFGNLPPFGMEIESKRLDLTIAYFRFNVFFDPEALQAELAPAVRGCGDCQGFIIDLRGNFGGIVGLASSVAAWFVPEQTPLGTMDTTTGKLKLTIIPRAEQFRGPVAVLVDALSISSAEFLAAGLKGLGRARLFGETTQGAALPSVVEKLPNGDRFQFAIADYVSAGGASVEGLGVTPHTAVEPTQRDYAAGKDPALDAARNWIRSQQTGNQPAGTKKSEKE